MAATSYIAEQSSWKRDLHRAPISSAASISARAVNDLPLLPARSTTERNRDSRYGGDIVDGRVS